MSWKEFFKPALKKIILFLILSSILYICLLFYDHQFLYSIHYFYLLTYFLNYLLACLFIFSWNKLRKIEERETKLYEWGMFFGLIIVALLRILIVLINNEILLYSLFSPFYSIVMFFDSAYYLTPIIAGIAYGLIISILYWIFTFQKEKEIISRRFWKIGLILTIILILIFVIVFLFKLSAMGAGCEYKKGEYEKRAYDSQGRVTGIINGEEKREIPDSFLFKEYSIETESGMVNVLPAKVILYNVTESYTHEIFCLKEGNYVFSTSSDKEGVETNFEATNIPISPGVTHKYSFDWDALGKGEEGATIFIDEDKDGNFEKSIVSDNKLSCEEFLIKTGKSSYSKSLGLKIVFIIIGLIIIISALILIIYIIKYKKQEGLEFQNGNKKGRK